MADTAPIMSIVLCFPLARTIHNAHNVSLESSSLPDQNMPLRGCAPTVESIRAARQALEQLGISPHDMRALDVLVPSEGDKRNSDSLRCHVWRLDLPARSLIKLDSGVYLAGIELCAFQAVRTMDEYELIEYYFELCSLYSMPEDPAEDYRELREPRTTVRKLKDYFLSLPDACRGRSKALRALRSVRDGSRSPMETGMTMAITVRVGLGGIQVRDLSMNYRVAIDEEARGLTRRKEIIFDAYIKRGRQDVEYQGARHNEELQSAIGNERRHVLQKMGYKIVEINEQQLFDREAFQRVMRTISENAGIRTGNRPDDFEERQERLRQFVIRRWRQQ